MVNATTKTAPATAMRRQTHGKDQNEFHKSRNTASDDKPILTRIPAASSRRGHIDSQL